MLAHGGGQGMKGILMEGIEAEGPPGLALSHPSSRALYYCTSHGSRVPLFSHL